MPLSDDPDREGRRLYLTDMEVQERKKVVTFVWTLTDPRTAAQMYLHRRKAKLRPAQKDDDEDVAISAHVVIDFDVPSGQMRYPTAIEDHEGVSRSRIQAHLETLLRQWMPEVTALIAEGVEKSGPPRLIMDAHPGRKIGNTEAKPVEIEVIYQTPRRHMTADHLDVFYEASERRVFKLARDGLAEELRGAALEFVRNLRSIYPGHRIRIRWRDEEHPSEPDQVTRIDPIERPERLLERALTRTVFLQGFRGLPDATESVIRRLADGMLAALREVTSEDQSRA